MSNINFNSANINTQVSNQELQKRLEAQENFGAIDREQLKQDTVEIAQKAGDTVKDNWFVSKLKAFGINDPKKKLKSIGMVILTIVGLTIAGDKTMSYMAQKGISVDEFLLKQNWYKKISNFFSNTKSEIAEWFKKSKIFGELAGNIKNTFENNKAKPIWQIARGTGQGPKTIFAITPVETLKNALINNKNKKILKEMAESQGKNGAEALRNLFFNSKNVNLAKEIGGILGSDASDLTKALNGFDNKTIDALSNLLEGQDLSKLDFNELLKNTQDKTLQQAIHAFSDKGIGAEATSSILSKVRTSEKYVRGLFDSSFGNNSAKFLNSLDDNYSSAISSLEALIGNDRAKVRFNELLNGKIESNMQWCDGLIGDIKAAQGFTTKKELLDFFEEIKQGKKGSDLINVTMDTGGITGAWWPVNFINGIAKKFNKGVDPNIGKGNVGEALMKYGCVSGQLADTKVGALVQNSIIIPAESTGNFGNDKSGMGAFLAFNLINLFDNIQDAPKEKKVAVAADDLLGSFTGWVITTPLAVATTYGLATLGRIEKADKNSGIINKALTGIVRTIGKFFNFGLEAGAKNADIEAAIKGQGLGAQIVGRLKQFANSLGGTAGGILRFALIMFVFSSIFQKPIKKVMHKIFGDPMVKKDGENAQTSNQLIPELGITQQELMERINKNPQALVEAQQNPVITKKLQENPKLLLDLLDGKDITQAQSSTPQAHQLSNANANLINSRKAQMNDNQALVSKAPEKTQNATEKTQNIQAAQSSTRDSATYIPSSAFTVQGSSYSPEMQNRITSIDKDADEVLKRAEKLMRGEF